MKWSPRERPKTDRSPPCNPEFHHPKPSSSTSRPTRSSPRQNKRASTPTTRRAANLHPPRRLLSFEVLMSIQPRRPGAGAARRDRPRTDVSEDRTQTPQSRGARRRRGLPSARLGDHPARLLAPVYRRALCWCRNEVVPLEPRRTAFYRYPRERSPASTTPMSPPTVRRLYVAHTGAGRVEVSIAIG